MIKRIHLENFKGIQNKTAIEFRPITLLFGPNNAGKSTIIQALHYLKEIFERKNFDPINTQTGGKAIDLGGFKALINNQDYQNKSVVLQVDLTSNVITDFEVVDITDKWDPLFDYQYMEKEYREYDSYVGRILDHTEESSIKIKIQWHSVLNRAEVTEFSILLNGEDFIKIDESRSTEAFIYFKLSEINFENTIIKKSIEKEDMELYKDIILNKDNRINVEIQNLFYAIPEWKHDFNYPDDFLLRFKDVGELGIRALKFLRIIKSVINNIGLQLLDELKEIRYIGPLREVPARGFIPHPRAEEERWANGIAAWDALFNQWVSIKIVDEWLNKLKTGYSISYKEYLNKYNNETSNNLKNFLEREFNDLVEYSRTLRSESEKRTKSAELFYYKRMIEIFDAINDNDSQKIKVLTKKFNDEFKEQLSQLNDSIYNSWFNISDELGDVKNDINEFVKNMSIEGNKETIKRLCLYDEKKQIHLEPYDTGVGITQVLPIIVAALMNDKNTLTVEQPELHIHPAMQTDLADLFISEINKRKINVLLETHSEHLMLRFLKRIRESNKNKDAQYFLTPEKIQVLYIETIDGSVNISSLEIDERGRFRNKWPRGFFEERIGEVS